MPALDLHVILWCSFCVPNADDFYAELVNINDVMRCDIHHCFMSKFQTICAGEGRFGLYFISPTKLPRKYFITLADCFYFKFSFRMTVIIKLFKLVINLPDSHGQLITRNLNNVDQCATTRQFFFISRYFQSP